MGEFSANEQRIIEALEYAGHSATVQELADGTGLLLTEVVDAVAGLIVFEVVEGTGLHYETGITLWGLV